MPSGIGFDSPPMRLCKTKKIPHKARLLCFVWSYIEDVRTLILKQDRAVVGIMARIQRLEESSKTNIDEAA